jgi:hypothetical protein
MRSRDGWGYVSGFYRGSPATFVMPKQACRARRMVPSETLSDDADVSVRYGMLGPVNQPPRRT